MPGIGVGELVVLATVGIAVVAYFAAVIALIAWGRRIATRRGGAWRYAAWLPVIGLVLQLGGTCATVASLIAVFRGLASTDAAARATLVARGISEAMSATACAVPISLLLYVGSAVLFAIGGRRRE